MIRHVKFAELPVEDQDRAIAFYTGKLGLKLARDSAYQQDWCWVELEIPGAETRLTLTRQSASSKEYAPRLVLVVDDVERAFRELSREGVTFTTEPSEAPWKPGETFAQFRDSEGNGIVISSM